MISIIIPTYNSSHFVRTAIESALNQTYRNFEIIVVDDGSTDDCRAVIDQYGDQVRYLWQENQGLAGARNTGIRAAHGEFVGLLDADDQWQPDYLATMVALAEQNPTAVVYYCQAQCMDLYAHDLPQVVGGPVIEPEAMYQTLLRANFLIPSTIMARRTTIVDAGLFDPMLRSCEDWDLWLRIAPTERFVGTDACLVRYRIHGSSLSTDLNGMHQAAQAVIVKNFGVDDGRSQRWSSDKKRAYGALYRYFTLTSVQRQYNWLAAEQHLRNALSVDPSRALDLEFFYDLVLGDQPVGYRGTGQQLRLKENANYLHQMLNHLFDTNNSWNSASLQRQTWGTANLALGLVAYNTGEIALSRQYLWSALRLQPELWGNRLVIGNLAKSFMGRMGLRWLQWLCKGMGQTTSIKPEE